MDLEAGVMGGQSALAGTAAQLMFDGGGGLNAGEASGGADGTGGRHAGGKMAEGAVGAGSAVGSSGGSGIGANQIPMKEVGEEEGKGCIVCHESFESEFDDASDQWVYKNIRRVPAGFCMRPAGLKKPPLSQRPRVTSAEVNALLTVMTRKDLM